MLMTYNCIFPEALLYISVSGLVIVISSLKTRIKVNKKGPEKSLTLKTKNLLSAIRFGETVRKILNLTKLCQIK